MMRCALCGRKFGGYRAFADGHRFDYCLPPAELRARGLILVDGVRKQRPPEVVAKSPREYRMPLRVPVPRDGTDGEAV